MYTGSGHGSTHRRSLNLTWPKVRTLLPLDDKGLSGSRDQHGEATAAAWGTRAASSSSPAGMSLCGRFLGGPGFASRAGVGSGLCWPPHLLPETQHRLVFKGQRGGRLLGHHQRDTTADASSERQHFPRDATTAAPRPEPLLFLAALATQQEKAQPWRPLHPPRRAGRPHAAPRRTWTCRTPPRLPYSPLRGGREGEIHSGQQS